MRVLSSTIKRWLLPMLLSAAVLQGCATSTETARGTEEQVEAETVKQQALALRTYWRRESRLLNLAWPLMVSAVDLCGEDVTPRFGVTPVSLELLPEDFRATAQQEFDFSEQLQVLHVIANSPADRAGLQSDDKLIRIAGEPAPTGRNAGKEFVERLKTAALAEGPVSFEIERDGDLQTIDVDPVPACKYGVVLLSNDVLNAFADGKNIYLTQGMMRFAETDEELQLVIAHEIAHNSEGHIKKKMGNSLLGTLLDVVAAGYGINTRGAFGSLSSMIFSQEFEREADYVGMYILARSDINTIDVADFWRRLAAEHPRSIRGTFSRSHPPTSERYANIEATHLEITEKINNQQPLDPERK